MCLTETHVSETITDSELRMDGYNMEKCCTVNNRTGGILMLALNIIGYANIKKLVTDNFAWILLHFSCVTHRIARMPSFRHILKNT